MKITIFYVICYLVEAVILWQCSTYLFIPRHKFKIRFVVLCILYLILFGALLFESKWLNMTLYLFANFIFLNLHFRLKWHSVLFYSAMWAAVKWMCELTVYSIVERITPHFLQGEINFYNVIIFAIFNKIMFFFIIYILIHIVKELKKDNQHTKSSFLLVFFPLTAAFVMLTFVSISYAVTLFPYLDWMVTLSAVFLLVTNLLVFGINQYNQKKNTEFKEMQLLLQKAYDSAEYYEMLRLQNENQRILIHDIKKHLQSIHLLNEQKDHDRINAYIQHLMLSTDLKESVRLCDHEMLNSILCRYMRQCSNKQIAFNADIRSGTIDLIADDDLTSLFCNLLENAMEAAGSIPESFIEISTSKRDKISSVVITVVNSCRRNPFSSKNGNLVTNKSDKCVHGFGIKSIRKTVTKYHGDMRMYYNDDTLTFHTIITLKP